MPISFQGLGQNTTGAIAKGRVSAHGVALADPSTIAHGVVTVSGQAHVKPPAPPVYSSDIPAHAEGAMYLDGQAVALAVLSDTAVALGQVRIYGNSAGTVVIALTPPAPPTLSTASGWVSVAGNAYAAVDISAHVDSAAAVQGQASSGALAQGQVRIIGQAGHTFAGGQASVFFTETPSVIQSYAGISFERINEIVTLGSQVDSLYTAVTREPFYLGSHAHSRYSGTGVISERLAVVSRLYWLIHALSHSGLALNSSAQADYTLIAKLINRLLLTGSATSVIQAQQQIVDALVWMHLSQALPKADTVDTLALSGHIQTLYTAWGGLLERLALQSRTHGHYRLTVLLNETVALGAAVNPRAELIAQLRDSIGFALHVDFDDGQYVAWVMNTQSRAVHRYVNFPFNSFAQIGSRYYGLHSSGLMRLHSGNTDDGQPIDAHVRLGLFDLGSRQVKGVPECFFGLATEGQMLLKAIFVDAVTGEKHSAIYQLHPRPAHAARETRVSLGRGMHAVDWDFALENVEGADFDLHHIDFHPMQLSRRIRG